MGRLVAQPAKKSNVKKTILIILAVISLIVVGAYLLMVVVVSGGPDNVISNIKPTANPVSPSMIYRRGKATKSIDSTFSKLEEGTGLVPYRTASHDLCRRGYNSWKTSEGFANQCALKITKFYGISDESAAVGKVASLGAGIIDLGWDKLDSKYRTEYIKPNGQINIEYQSTSDSADYLLDTMQKVYTRLSTQQYEKDDLVDAQSVLNLMASQYGYVVVVSIEEVYFKN